MPGLWVRHSASSAAVVRESLRTTLLLAGFSDDEAYEATLLASELVGNAVRHAPPLPSGHLAVRWSVGEGLCRFAVTDGGVRTELTPAHPDDGQVSGRGLAIVAALSEAWGVEHDDQGTTVWAVYRFGARSRLRSTFSTAS